MDAQLVRLDRFLLKGKVVVLHVPQAHNILTLQHVPFAQQELTKDLQVFLYYILLFYIG